ncbi:unnamed protein product [Eruca vesicaria subsp. sativa]|uniref:Late embryogenesis abundant protein LEA-2 subgroup domain-containing protein n=1 Tax=Eruca vesicaria subsp. sativa TaxID=29727 RepID=A0ABC8LRM7_ERUVS|nr:unnamed protein product [Eruca vesicaria subsp. sativa]
MGSPPHSQFSKGRHSRESSSTRFSGSLKPGSRKVNDGSKGKGHGGEKQWKECAMIEEEGLLDDGERDRGLPRRCYVLAFIVGFFILFGLFSLILYGAAKPQKPKITVKSITFETLKVQAGQDAGGVGTDMITMNATLRMLSRNTGTFFGVHVTSTPIDLSFSQMKIGSGSRKHEDHLFKWEDEAFLDEIHMLHEQLSRLEDHVEKLKMMKTKEDVSVGCVGTIKWLCGKLCNREE